MVFEARVFRFVGEKEFIPHNFKETMIELKVWIAATAVQITFGFLKLLYATSNGKLFIPILIYSTITGRRITDNYSIYF